MKLPGKTRVWHAVDVVFGLIEIKRKPNLWTALRLSVALIGLAGNVLIERDQLKCDVIEIGGVKWKRCD